MWELWMQLDYDHLYKANSSKKQKFFQGIPTLSLLNLLLWRSRFLKKASIFPFRNLLTTGWQIKRKLFCY